MKQKITITIAKIFDCEDSLFYDGQIAYLETKDKVYSVEAHGDINIAIGEDWFNNGNLWEAIDKYKLTDKKLVKLEEDGQLEWHNNNWFEIIIVDKKTKVADCEIGNVAYDYDSAIQLLKDKIFDCEGFEPSVEE